jgi:hypothetical protein
MQAPVIIKIIEPQHDPTGLSDVLIGALGLTGVLVLLGILLAVGFGAVLFWLRSRSDQSRTPRAS